MYVSVASGTKRKLEWTNSLNECVLLLYSLPTQLGGHLPVGCVFHNCWNLHNSWTYTIVGPGVCCRLGFAVAKPLGLCRGLRDVVQGVV